MEKEKTQSIDKELLNRIAIRIKKLRAKKNITQEIFYNDTSINIGRIERSKRNFSISTMEKICKYLNVTLEEFFSKGFDKN